jgi:hypothetical protein
MGCALPAQTFKNGLYYEPVQVGFRVPAGASVEVTHVVSPEVRAIWKAWLNPEENIVSWEKAVVEITYEDLAKSGIFTSVSPNNPNADVLISIQSREVKSSDSRLQLSLSVLNPRTRETVLSYNREQTYSTSITNNKFKETLRGVMGEIKAEMVADFKSKDLSKLGGNFAIGTTTATSSPGNPASESVRFEDLLVSKEASVPIARQRTRLLVAAKTLTLPTLLREKKTTELTGLAVQIEQLILDLNHEAEMEKDRAQRALEQNPQAAEDHRELAIAYKERIEVLKPIGTEIKEEIVNRAK